ncbi:LysR family transcriptional regulator [Lachnospiraceae bacterium NSJ-143]|nr:LysR family transcriptional regulator [Lachnospiraceae bacterium NSJ-143]
MSIQKYKALLKTIEYGSFTEAARVLDYSQSGISRMINDLETEWNVTLLERGHSGVKLTSDGIKLLPFIKNVCDEHSRLVEQIDDMHGIQSGLIRIGTFSSVAAHWLPHIIKHFQQRYPNIDYELLVGDYAEIEEWTVKGRVDCGFLILPVDSCLDTVFLEQDRLLAVLPANHPMAGCGKFPLKAFEDYPFMLLEKAGKAEISEIFERNNVRPNIHFKTIDDYAIMSMVESGLGISILPELILKRIPYNIVVKELEFPVYRNIVLALKSRKNASPAVKRFLDYLEYRNRI